MRLLFIFIILPILSFSQTDSVLIADNKAIINTAPSEENAKIYFQVAQALYKSDETQKAKQMLTYIAFSDLYSYIRTYPYHPIYEKDTINYFKGYGSEAFNYKHFASLSLTEIYIQEKDFDNAMRFLKIAEEDYPLWINCGTGSMLYLQKMENYHFECNRGIEEMKKAKLRSTKRFSK